MIKIIVGVAILLMGIILPEGVFGWSLVRVAGIALLVWGVADKAIGTKFPDIRPLEKLGDLSVFHCTGTAVSIQSRTVVNSLATTSTSGGIGSIYNGTGTILPTQTYTSISSQSINVVRHFVREDDGHEFSFELNDPPLAAREGHRLTTVYAGNAASSTKGHLVAVANHVTGKKFHLPYTAGVDSLITKEQRVPIWLLIVMAAGTFFVSAYVIQVYGNKFEWLLVNNFELAILLFLAVMLLPAAAMLACGIFQRHRANRKEDLLRKAIVANIDAHLAKVVADECFREAKEGARDLKRSVGILS